MEERKNIFARIEDTIRSYFNPEFPVVPKLRNELGIDPVFNFKGSNDRVKGLQRWVMSLYQKFRKKLYYQVRVFGSKVLIPAWENWM
ncbi:hypothetical protein [Persicobacter diffluens]|uniref:Uncharacterized protein n=1 Tax=Persicobacter diffluens TaxID=981 RepID=A0AAN4W5K9_9BACT|nr:hypothetical protein PEDI_50720 [Persicobacter diffluens]